MVTRAEPNSFNADGSTRPGHIGRNDAGEIGSVALVPLGEHGAIGLLALGSHDRERFHPGMSTEFLARMGELIADAVVYR